MKITLAATQFACSTDAAANLDSAERVTRAAAARGAQVVLLQELFETPYFCRTTGRALRARAPVSGSPVLERFRSLAPANSRSCCRSASSSARRTRTSIRWR